LLGYTLIVSRWRGVLDIDANQKQFVSQEDARMSACRLEIQCP
jgi:hypothetical protein